MFRRILTGLVLTGFIWTLVAQPVRVNGSTQQQKLVRQDRPIYPPEAKQQGIQGHVLLQAVIDKQGRIKDLEVLNGNALLVTASLEAVRGWEYVPTIVDGEPIEVITLIHVNFTLAGSSEAQQRIRVAAKEQVTKVVNRVKPEYPPDAKQAGIEGTVQLEVVIDKEGAVKDVHVLSGDAALVPAAVKAVKQWTYEPTLKDEQPVEVISQIELNFKLQQ